MHQGAGPPRPRSTGTAGPTTWSSPAATGSCSRHGFDALACNGAFVRHTKALAGRLERALAALRADRPTGHVPVPARPVDGATAPGRQRVSIAQAVSRSTRLEIGARHGHAATGA